MVNSSDPYDGLTKALSTLSATVVFLLGLFFTILSIVLLRDVDFQAMNNMIGADAAWAGQPALSFDIDKAAIFIAIVGILAMIAAFLGCFGALSEHHSLICTYFLSVVVLGVWFLFTFVAVLNFNTVLVPIADRQATQFCNVTQFYTFKAELGCTFPAVRSGGPCGPDCSDRVNLLREMDGCNLLRVMCHSFDWQPVGPGHCLAESQGGLAMPTMWQGSAQTSTSCLEVCNEHVSCSSASFSDAAKACNLYMELQPTTGGTWTKTQSGASDATSPILGSDGQPGLFCTKKDKPTVVVKAASFGKTLAWLSGCAAIIACMAMCCTCSLLYTTSTRRKGKKGACPLLHKLLCPCCVGTENRRFEDEQELETLTSRSDESELE